MSKLCKVIVPIAIIVWLTVTFLTKPEKDSTLKEFYRRIQPGGWWGQIAKDITRTKSNVTKGFLSNWLAGIAFIFGATFAIGNLIFGTGIKPNIVVGIPCHDEYRNIGKLIEAARKQLEVDHHDKSSVIVVIGERPRFKKWTDIFSKELARIDPRDFQVEVP